MTIYTKYIIAQRDFSVNNFSSLSDQKTIFSLREDGLLGFSV
jgi:hypothetical protein